ncbi:hypothetical protein FH968_08960 [Buttiauxella sp. B2]|nr:hypothetical protein FH968_08960 [Buttiauxella sp. B2]
MATTPVCRVMLLWSCGRLVAQGQLCHGSCHVHGHQHDAARKSVIPVSDEGAFWGVMGCSCFTF